MCGRASELKATVPSTSLPPCSISQGCHATSTSQVRKGSITRSRSLPKVTNCDTHADGCQHYREPGTLRSLPQPPCHPPGTNGYKNGTAGSPSGQAPLASSLSCQLSSLGGPWQDTAWPRGLACPPCSGSLGSYKQSLCSRGGGTSQAPPGWPRGPTWAVGTGHGHWRQAAWVPI